MLIRLRSNESPAEGIRRVLVAEIDGALLAAADAHTSATALHEMRKRLKKLRAIVALARDAFGGAAAIEDRRLRDTARMLARHREADALDGLLTAEARQAGSADVEDLRASVRLHHEAGTVVGNRQRDLGSARRELLAMRRRFSALGFAGLTRGACRRRFRKAYKRTSAAYRNARQNPTEDAFHQWRKQAKQLLNQVRMLGAWGGRDLADYGRRLVQLDDQLGRARDCAFLAFILRGVPAAETPLRYGFGLRARLDAIARDETASALRLGGRMFRRKSRAFVRRMLPRR